MTASPQPPPQNPLRVVPPPAPSPPAPETPPAVEASVDDADAIAATPARKFPLRLLLIAGGLTLAGLIRVPYQVGGEVTLAGPEGQRQVVRAPAPAIIEEFYVAPGDEVAAGQPLVKLSSRDLDREIANARDRIADAQTQFQEARREQTQAEARLIEAQAQAQAAQARANRLQTRLNELDQGILPPDMQALTAQRDRLQGQLTQARIAWERAQSLHARGAIALADLEAEEQRYDNLQRDLQTQQAEIQTAQQRLADATADEQGIANFQQANVMAANAVAQATEQVEAHRATITVSEQRLQELQQQQTAMVLTSNQAGTVLDRDLDLRLGEAVTPADTLLQIADLDQLTAEVQVKQEDINFVESGATVTFRPDSDKLTAYDATVMQIVPRLEVDQTQQRQVAIAKLMIDNSAGNLRPNASGYAKIFSQWMPLYQRIGREVIKLWPSKFL